MSPRPFIKMHGLGNDFIVFDARALPITLTPAKARALADRKTGIGCDQLIIISPSAVATAHVRFWNCAGAEIEACGNGSRAVATLLGGHATIETVAGVLTADADGDQATVDMGLPRFGWAEVPLAYAMDTAALPVAWEGLENPAAASIGNPHVTFFVDDPAGVALGELGPLIEKDPLFPHGVNVGVAAMRGRAAMTLRVWERGAGLTRACGTGAVAAVANAQRRGLADARVMVTLPGGDLTITRRDDGHMLMTGPAVVSFTGMVDVDAYA